MTHAVETIALSKDFFPSRSPAVGLVHPFRKKAPVHAVNAVTLEIGTGEVFALVGPNGSGKTTFLKMLTCLITPTSGRALVLGFDVSSQELQVKSRIGFASGDERSFYWRLTLQQNLDFFASLYNLSAKEARQRITSLAGMLGIAWQLQERFQECSAGTRQKMSIARSLLNEPEVLFMDEPTKSLDPASRKQLLVFLRDTFVKRDGKTVVLTTHHPAEVEEYADRVALIGAGQIRACAAVDELRREAGAAGLSPEELYSRLMQKGGA